MKSVCRPRQIRHADRRAASLLLRNLPFFPSEEKEGELGGSHEQLLLQSTKIVSVKVCVYFSR